MSDRPKRFRGFSKAGLPGPRRLLLLLVLALVALPAAACSDEGAPGSSQATLPPWLVRVYPEPGDVSAAHPRVEVDHHVTTDGENVRLSIDGVDVTQYAELGREATVGGPGKLVYDPEDANQVVALDPGRHKATVEHVRLTGIGGETRVLDSYSWEFQIQ